MRYTIDPECGLKRTGISAGIPYSGVGRVILEHAAGMYEGDKRTWVHGGCQVDNDNEFLIHPRLSSTLLMTKMMMVSAASVRIFDQAM
jgi:hypothetical protein